jgi:hypothetical protein
MSMYLQKVINKKNVEKTLTIKTGSGSERQWYRSAGPDPYQNVTDPQHWMKSTKRTKPSSIFLMLPLSDKSLSVTFPKTVKDSVQHIGTGT